MICIPLSSKLNKRKIPTHTYINADKDNNLRYNSIALCEMFYTLDKSKLIKKIGYLNDNVMQNINKSIAVSLGMLQQQKY